MHFLHAVKEPAAVFEVGRGGNQNNQEPDETSHCFNLSIFFIYYVQTLKKISLFQKYGRPFTKKPGWESILCPSANSRSISLTKRKNYEENIRFILY